MKIVSKLFNDVKKVYLVLPSADLHDARFHYNQIIIFSKTILNII